MSTAAAIIAPETSTGRTPAVAQPNAAGTGKHVVLVALSMGNGYYNNANTSEAIRRVLKALPADTADTKYEVRPFVPSRPAVSTYVAIGYTTSKAERTVGQNTRRLLKAAREGAGGDPRYVDSEWDDLTGGEADPKYAGAIALMEAVFAECDVFRRDVDLCTERVLEKRGKCTPEGVATGRRYLIEEFACLWRVLEALNGASLTVVYHVAWPELERLFAGEYRGLGRALPARLQVLNVTAPTVAAAVEEDADARRSPKSPSSTAEWDAASQSVRSSSTGSPSPNPSVRDATPEV